jgi:hypothetical protein
VRDAWSLTTHDTGALISLTRASRNVVSLRALAALAEVTSTLGDRKDSSVIVR